MSEQKRSFSWRLVAAALLVAGGAGAYFYLQGMGRKLTPLDSAKIVPDDALLAAYIDTDSQNWDRLQQFGTPEAQAAIAKGFESLQQGILPQEELNYQQDLKPWVGDIMLALLPPSSDSGSKPDSESSSAATPASEAANNSEVNTLLVVGIQNPLKAWMFQRNFKSQADIKVAETEYKGVKISITNVGENPATYSMIIGKHLVLADRQASLEKAIDSYQASTSVAASEQGNEMIEKWQEIKNPVIQVHLPNADLLTQQFQANFSATAKVPEQLEGLKYAVIGAGIDTDGIRVKMQAKVDPALFKQVEPTPENASLLNRFPIETIALFTGQNLKLSWENLGEQAKIDPTVQSNFDFFKSAVKTSTNLDLDRDIFNWMDGQFALGFIASNQGILAQLGFGGAILLETSDRPLAEATMKKIDATFKTKFPIGLEANATKYQNMPVTEWRIPSQDIVLGGYGWLEQNLLLIALGQPLIELMSQPIQAPLNTSNNFQAIAGSLPTTNHGYFYLNMDQVMTLLNRAPLPPGNQISPEVLAVLNSIQGMGLTSTWPEADMAQVDLLLALKPKQ
jgi:hypothetical protein